MVSMKVQCITHTVYITSALLYIEKCIRVYFIMMLNKTCLTFKYKL